MGKRFNFHIVEKLARQIEHKSRRMEEEKSTIVEQFHSAFSVAYLSELLCAVERYCGDPAIQSTMN